MALMTEARLKPYFDQWQVVPGQKRFRTLDAKLDEVLVRRGPGGPFEFTREMKAAHSCDLGQLGQSQIPTVIVCNKLRYFSQLYCR